MYIYTHTIQLNELISPKLLLLAPFKPIKKKKNCNQTNTC